MDLSAVEKVKSTVFGTLSIDLPGGFVFQPSYLQAGLILFLIFLLILTFGSLRHRMSHWAMQGIMPGIAFGFAIAILIEGMLLVGGGTILTQVLGWKNAPKPITTALDQGRGKLINVLGAEDSSEEISKATKSSPDLVIHDYNKLSPSESESVRRLICE